jgi:hypothetical protein
MESVPGTRWREDWVCPSSGVDAQEKRNNYTAGNLTRAVQPVSRRYTDWAIPTPFSGSIKDKKFLPQLRHYQVSSTLLGVAVIRAESNQTIIHCPKSWESKIWSWVPRDSELRVNVLARTDSNLLDLSVSIGQPLRILIAATDRI